MPTRKRQGKAGMQKRTVGETIKRFFTDKKIEYSDDGLLTDESVTFLKEYFKAEDCIVEGRRKASHVSAHGGHMTDAQLIDKLILTDQNLTTKYKNISTQFSSERQQWTAILDTLCEQDQKWINDHQSSYVRNGSQFIYTTQTDSVMINPADKHIEPCAHTTGFTITNRLIYACDTGDYATVVTTRDSSIPIGFSIQTAYPGMAYDPKEESDQMQRNAIAMDPAKRRSKMTLYSDDYTETLRQTKRYEQAKTVMEKTAILLQGRSDAIFGKGVVTAETITQTNISLSDVKQSHRDNSEYVAFTKYNDDGTTCRLTIKEDDVLVKKTDSERQVIPFINDTGFKVKAASRSRRSLPYIQNTMPEIYNFALAAEECVQIAKRDFQQQCLKERNLDDLVVPETDETPVNQDVITI